MCPPPPNGARRASLGCAPPLNSRPISPRSQRGAQPTRFPNSLGFPSFFPLGSSLLALGI
uniref:ORF 1-1 protein n=1 Tax=Equid alphaherpesvirus 1 TaxID=10326 RepID=O42055_9ALPH|nr:ORF 1-1 [Equid alphaherpesvirus 1]BAA20033.1 ORF 1-1 [Equid alphaherpesvirus 1]